jgi:hypothetical protein
MLASLVHGAATEGCTANFVVGNVATDYPWMNSLLKKNYAINSKMNVER